MTKRTAKLLMTDALKYARQEVNAYRRHMADGDKFSAAMDMRFVRDWLREAKRYKEVLAN